MVFYGPVQEGVSESIFHATGRTVRTGGGGGSFAGPVQSGINEELFHLTGQSVQRGSVQETQLLQQRATAKRIADAEAKRIVEEQNLLRADLDRQVQEGRIAGTIGGQVSGQNVLSKSFITKTKPFGTRGKPTATFGVPFITQAERDKGIVGFVSQDPFAEQPFSSGIQTSPTTLFSGLFGRTKGGNIIATQKNIFKREEMAQEQKEFKADPESFIGRAGVETEETPSGTKISLTPAFWENLQLDKSSTERAYDFWEGLTPEQKRKAKISSVATGIGKVGVGILEFGGTLISSLGVQKFEGGEDLKSSGFFGRQFKIGGKLGLGSFTSQLGMPTTTTFRDDPKTFLKQKLSDPELVTSGLITAGLISLGGISALKNIKSLGLRGGVGQILGGLSPLRPVSGLYVPKITADTKFDIVSLKTGQGDYTTRYIFGKGKTTPASIRSIQDTKLLGGGAVETGTIATQITTPATYITRGGRVLTGWQVSGSEGFTFSGGRVGTLTGLGEKGFSISGIQQDKLLGSLMEGFSQPRYSLFVSGDKTGILGFGKWFPKDNLYKIFRGGGVSGKLNEVVTGFTSGRRTSVGAVIDDVYQPSGRYRFNPTLTGKEFDLNKMFKIGSGDGGTTSFISKGGGKKTPLTKTFGSDQILSSQLASIQSSVASVTPPAIVSKSGGVILGVGSAKTQDVKVETQKSISVQSFIEEQKSILASSEKSISAQSLLTQQRTRTVQRQEATTMTRFATASILGSLQTYKQIQQQPLLPKPLMSRGVFRSGGVFGYGGLPIFPPFRLGISLGGKKTKPQIKKQKTRYQPSFTSLALDIQDIVPKDYFKKGYGALRIRPISILKGKRIRRKGWIF